MRGPGWVEEGWQESPYERNVAYESWNKNKMALFRMDRQPAPKLAGESC